MSDAVSASTAEPTKSERADLPNYLTGKIPFWLSLFACTMLAMPLAVYLGVLAIPLYVSFVVWTAFFVLGGTNATLKRLYPSFIFGALYIAVWELAYVWLSQLPIVPDPKLNTVLALGIPTGIAFASLSKILTLGWPIVSEPLPAYNGGQMWFAVYFGAATWPLTDNPYLLVLICGLTVTAAGLIGGLIGVTSVALTFPRRAASSHRD
jgi:hypothetical protein